MGIIPEKDRVSPPSGLMRMPWPWIVLLIALLLTFIGWRWSSEVVVDNVRLRFNSQAEDARLILQSRLNNYAQVLRGAAALLAASKGVTRQEWREYVTSLRLGHFLPGIAGLGYAPYLRADEKTRFEQGVREEGFPDFAIWPKGDRKHYVPVNYIEPFAGANLRAFGYDMYDDPVRRAAMDRARDSSQIVLSGNVGLVQDGDQQPVSGFLLYAPVYDYRLPLATLSERRAAIRGFAYIPFRLEELISDTLGNRQQGIMLRIYEGSRPDPARLLYVSREEPRGHRLVHVPLFTRSLPLEFGGQTWTLLFESQPAFYLTLDRLTPMLVLVGGLLLSVLLFGITWSLTRTRERAQALAMQMTEELREGEARFRATFHQAAVGMTQSSPEGHLLQVNQRFCSMLGYDRPEELLNRHVLDLSPPDDREAHRRLRESVLNGQASSYVLEKRYLCRDGRMIWGRLTGSLVRHANGEPHYLIGIVEDITQTKEATQALQESYENLKQMHQELESFSYSVSHDLRTPLRAIEGFALILQEDYRDRLDEEGFSHLQRIRMASQRMAGLIDALLSLARVNRQQLAREEVNLSAKASEIAQSLKSSQPGRQVDFIIASGVRAIGDPYMLEAVLENLLGNAWKFTSPRPRTVIEFGAFELNGEKIFFVKDNGVGFDMAYVDKLFGAFQRLHKADEFKGYGIGLATAQRIIQRHGGRVWAEGSPGQGATFYFTLNHAAGTAMPEKKTASM